MSTEEVLTTFRRDAPYLFLARRSPLSAWCPLPLPFSGASVTRSSSALRCSPLGSDDFRAPFGPETEQW